MRLFARRWSFRAAIAPAFVTLLVTLLTVRAPVIAWAHGVLTRSSPASGAHLDAVPRELRLTFTEAPELAVTTISLLSPDGIAVPLGGLQLAADRRMVVAAIRGPLAAGPHTVVWKMAGADGHPIRGRFRFTIAPGARDLAPPTPAGPIGKPSRISPNDEDSAAVAAPGQSPAPNAHHDAVTMPEGVGFGVESVGYVVLRWFQFTALLLVVGAIAFRSVVLRLMRRATGAGYGALDPLPERARARAATIGLWAAVATALAALLRLYAQSSAMHGPSDAMNGTLIGPMVWRTVWGWGWLLQVAGVGAALTGFSMAQRAEQSASALARGAGKNQIGWALATIGGLVLAFTPALSGHAVSARSLTPLAVIADAAHVVGASGWLGSLALVLLAGVPAALSLADGERGQAVADLVNAYSPTALAFAGLAAVTGVFATWLHLGALATLWQTPYGQTLLLKIGVLSLVAGTGAFNWLRVKPTLGDIEGVRRVRRSATVEIAIACVVLLITAVLVATPPPAVVEDGAAGANKTAARSEAALSVLKVSG
jgi:copper transport protein